MTLQRVNGESLPHHLNSDPEFALQAREMTARIRFVEDGVPVFLMKIVQGRVTEVDLGVTPFDAFDFQLGGTAEHWERLLVSAPEAFYHDWFPAMFHHGFQLEGNFELIMAYYPALVRLRQLLVDAIEKAEAA